jgi:hypothetical protein
VVYIVTATKNITFSPKYQCLLSTCQWSPGEALCSFVVLDHLDIDIGNDNFVWTFGLGHICPGEKSDFKSFDRI